MQSDDVPLSGAVFHQKDRPQSCQQSTFKSGHSAEIIKALICPLDLAADIGTMLSRVDHQL